MLANESRDSAPLPERSPSEQLAVDNGRVKVSNDRGRDVPALPPGFGSPVTEVDVLAVETELFVEAAELLEHFASKQQERGEHPIRLDRLGRPLVQKVVVPLA